MSAAEAARLEAKAAEFDHLKAIFGKVANDGLAARIEAKATTVDKAKEAEILADAAEAARIEAEAKAGLRAVLRDNALRAAGGFVPLELSILAPRNILTSDEYRKALQDIVETPWGFTVKQVLTLLKCNVVKDEAKAWEVTTSAAAAAANPIRLTLNG